MSETVTVVYTEGASGDDHDQLLGEHGGTRERATEDGQLLAFRSARAALGYAVARKRTAASPLRIGIHTGEPERGEGELRGRALLKAARIAALARGGEILVSEVVRELADLDADGDIWFEDGSEVALRGLRGRHLVLPGQCGRSGRAPRCAW